MGQIAPVFFSARPDISGHFLFATGLQHAIVQHAWLQVVLDIVFVVLNPLMAIVFIRGIRMSALLACCTVAFNIVYAYFFSSISFVSREPFIAWMLMPLLFTATGCRSFYFKFHVLRILFILFFATAGLWKLRGGGAFNAEQMSGILLHQFASVLAVPDSGWHYQLLRFLINHPPISFVLYWLVILAEVIFLLGLFTRKYDRLLLWLLLGFLVCDYFLMQINYFSWLPFAVLFYYSQLEMPVQNGID